MAQTIKIRRGGIGAIGTSTPTTLKGELILATGSFSGGVLGTSLFAAEANNTLRLTHGRIDSVSDGSALATAIGNNDSFTGLLIHSASDNKLYRYSGTAFVELPIAAGSFEGILPVANGGTGTSSLGDIVGDSKVVVQNGTDTIIEGSDGPVVLTLSGGVVTGSAQINGSGINENAIDFTYSGGGISGGTSVALNSSIELTVTTGSITENGTNLVDAGTLFTLSSSIANDINANTGNVEGVTGQVAYFDDTNSVSGSSGFTFASDVLTVGTSTFGLNTTIAGNLTVAGTTTTIDSTNVNIGDRIIVLNTAEASQDGGIQVIDTDGNQTGSLLWDRASNYWKAGLEGGTHYRLPELTSTTNITDNTLIVADSNGRLEGSGKFTEDGTNGIVDAPKFTNLAGANTNGAGVLIIEPTSNEVTSVTTEGSDELAHIFGTKTDGTLVFSNVIDGGTF